MGMEHRIDAHAGTILPGTGTDWVPETRFGRWFLSTGIWRDYVLTPAIDTLAALAGGRVRAGSHILDIGCGAGTATPLLDARFRPRRITGIDIDPELVAEGRDRWSAERPGAALTLTEGSATAIPLADGTVDVVLCHQLLHHMIPQREALAEMRRILRPGGLLLLAESCRCFIDSPPVRLLFRHPRETQRSAAGYLDLIRGAGFRLGDGDVVAESPWWSLPDLGLRRRRAPGRGAPAGREPTELLAVAERPA